MPSSGSNRRLATILFADIDGYSRLMRADEEQTFDDLHAHLPAYMQKRPPMRVQIHGSEQGEGIDSLKKAAPEPQDQPMQPGHDLPSDLQEITSELSYAK